MGRPLALIRGLGLALGLAMLLISVAQSAKAAPESDELKAAYLFNFAKFVAWPEDRFDSASAALVFCMVGKNPLHGALGKITTGRSVQGREIEIQNYASPSAAKACHIVFLDSGVSAQSADVLKKYDGGGVLTVGEVEGFAKSGGVANFFIDGKKVRFEINKQAAQDQGLKISSRLLKLARIVSTEDN
jgi:hypothetical protein